MLPNFKTGWALLKTNKVKPLGFKGFIFTLYEKDDITVKTERFAKTASKIWYEIVKLQKGEE